MRSSAQARPSLSGVQIDHLLWPRHSPAVAPQDGGAAPAGGEASRAGQRCLPGGRPRRGAAAVRAGPGRAAAQHGAARQRSHGGAEAALLRAGLGALRQGAPLLGHQTAAAGAQAAPAGRTYGSCCCWETVVHRALSSCSCSAPAATPPCCCCCPQVLHIADALHGRPNDPLCVKAFQRRAAARLVCGSGARAAPGASIASCRGSAGGLLGRPRAKRRQAMHPSRQHCQHC
jgi:hypothetical protein